MGSVHCKALNLKFYSDLNYNDFQSCNRLVIQLVSLFKCNYKLFKNGIVILDEINSLLSHLRSPTLNNRRKKIYLYLIELIKNARYVISLDADLSDWNIDFLQAIEYSEYIVYYNTFKNKLDNNAIFYKSSQTMIDIMKNNIINNKYFVACFDSLTSMKKIIDYLANFGNKSEWIIYSSEINYSFIDTKEWISKFVFYTPTIIYGIDFNYESVDVFCYISKNHLNSLQIYQMISRARIQETVHIFCKEKEYYV
jgi:hypothetical protein